MQFKRSELDAAAMVIAKLDGSNLYAEFLTGAALYATLRGDLDAAAVLIDKCNRVRNRYENQDSHLGQHPPAGAPIVQREWRDRRLALDSGSAEQD